MTLFRTITVALVVVFVVIGLNWLYYEIMGKRSAKIVSQEEFREGMRKAQVIDVREKNEFDAGHIMGARNIPFTVLKQSITAIRKDQPVYLYDSTKTLSVRAANKLRKEGYKEIYVLKEGYDGWDGKTKKKN
ncbi:rhodanese-like domain-containing protein [Enterococcus olivae]